MNTRAKVLLAFISGLLYMYIYIYRGGGGPGGDDDARR